MFNPTNLALEIFGILRSFDYTVNTFDFDGNRVYEPGEARRFFATPKNITVSISEEGENSGIKLFLSQSTSATEVTGLISTMRTTASKFGVLFNVRKYERELKPKDLSPNAEISFVPGISMAKGEAEADYSDEAGKLDRIKDEVGELTNDFGKIMKHISTEKNEKVKESMEHEPLEEKRGEEMIELPALGCSVEVAAWEAFKNGQINLYSPPESFGDAQMSNPTAEMVLKLKAVASKASADGLANMLSRVADALEHGSTSALYKKIASEAISLGYGAVEEGVIEEKRGAELISLPALGGIEVEKDAWEQFKNGSLALHSAVDFSAELGSSVSPEAFYLRQIADVAAADGMANMFARVADDLDVGAKTTPERRSLARAIANMAISAAKGGGSADLTEGLIITESVQGFMKWFDTMSHTKLFEDFDDDYDRFRDSPEEERMSDLLGDTDELSGSFDDAVDIAYNSVEEDFSVAEFLESHGSDFNYEDDTLSDEDKTLTADYVKSSLSHYLRQKLEDVLDGEEFPSEKDVSFLADKFLPDVKDTMESEGWTINDEIAECDTDLKNEDVLLPKNPKDDLTHELTTQTTADDDADARRIVALARPTTL